VSLFGEYALGEELPHDLFSGGDESNSFLESLGFNIRPKAKGDWTDRECYFAVWGYDQFELDPSIVKTQLYSHIANLIGRSAKAVEWKLQNVSACDPRPRSQKPIAEAPNAQGLLKTVFENYWADKVKYRNLYGTFVQGATFNLPASVDEPYEPENTVIEEGAPGYQATKSRKRSTKLLKAGRKYYSDLEPDKKLRCKACEFVKPDGIKQEIVQLHHTVPISDAGEGGRSITINEAVKLLLPLCPNCHQIAHTETPPMELDNIKGYVSNS